MRQCIDRTDVVAPVGWGCRLGRRFFLFFHSMIWLFLLVCTSQRSMAQTVALPSSPSPPSLSLLLSPDDPPAVYYAALTLFANWGWETSPIIVAMEPGPLILKGGLKLLPNQIPPRLTIPDLLVVCNMGNLDMKLQFIAFMRRVLLDGGSVWVVGSHFPESLISMPLSPGQEIELLQVQELEQRLARYQPAPITPAPNLWLPMLRWR